MFPRLNKRIFTPKNLIIASSLGTACVFGYNYARHRPVPQPLSQSQEPITIQPELQPIIQSDLVTGTASQQSTSEQTEQRQPVQSFVQAVASDPSTSQTEGEIPEEKKQPVKQQTLVPNQEQKDQNKQQEARNVASVPKMQKNWVKGRIPYKDISEIPEFTLQQLSAYEFDDGDFVLMVADLPYNRQFEEELLTKMRNILKKRKSKEPLQIYRVDTKDPQIREILAEKFKSGISEETILILKHPFEKNLTSINFDMIVRSPQILPVFLSDLNLIGDQGTLENHLKSMSAHKTYLIFIVDSSSADYGQTLLSAKYIEMELEIQNLESIKLLVMDQKVANQSNFLLNNPKVRSMHLVRKSNQFTYKAPNRFLFGGNPYHVLENINLFDKKRELMIQKYLNKIQTFSSMAIEAPFVCYITIDRNKITPKEERQVLKVFSRLKSEQIFPHVSFIVKFAEVPYRGNQEEPYGHKRWSVMVANVDQLTKETFIHEIKSLAEAKKLEINQQNWQKKTYQFLYREPELNESALKEFIQNCVQGKQQFYYKTQKKIKLQKLNKITGQNFQQQILQDKQRSHWLFQYSDHCASCSMLAPIIQNFAEIVELFPDLKSRVHGVNCDRNRIKGQPYSPYTPNLYYYSKKWGNRWPLRYPLMDFVRDLGIKGIYDFSEITQSLEEVNSQLLEKHIKQVQKYKNLLEEL